MLSKQKSVVIATIATLLVFLSVAYTSCVKTTADPYTCDNVKCENKGYCKKGVCICPTGYEGEHCTTPSVDKYIAFWDAHETILASTNPAWVGKDSDYVVFLEHTGTPTTFFINNFYGDSRYNLIISTLDSVNSSIFTVDTLSAQHMLYDHFRILPSSSGYITAKHDTIFMHLFIKHLDSTVNWQSDEMNIWLSKHQF